MKADLKRLLIHTVVLLAGSALLGTVLLVLAFCIPTGPIREHVNTSVDRMLRPEEKYPENPFLRHIWQHKESYTDSIMVQYAFEKIADKNAFEHAMWAYHYDLEDEIWAAEDSLRTVLADGEPSGMYLREYSRYWHGYLVYLKPLLLLFTWENLVWLGAALQLILFVLIVVLSIRKKQGGVALAMACGLLLMKPELMVVSLTMSVCSLITLAAVLFLLCCSGWLEKKHFYPEFFLCIGILTAYFDFLTYPVVTLGFPLCVFFLLKGSRKVLETVKLIVLYGLCWTVGYAGMWASKWVIADVTLGTGTIRDAVWNVIGRTEAIGGRPRMNGGFYVISLNFNEYDSVIYGVIAGGLILLTVLVLLWALARRVSVRSIIEVTAPYVLTAVIPFAWIVVVQHHSALHARFTFRILGVAAMAFACICIQIYRTVKFHKNI